MLKKLVTNLRLVRTVGLRVIQLATIGILRVICIQGQPLGYKVCNTGNTKSNKDCCKGWSQGYIVGTSVRCSSGRCSGGRLLAMTQWQLFSSDFSFSPHFPLPPFFPPSQPFLISRIKKLIQRKLLRTPKNLWGDTFPDISAIFP